MTSITESALKSVAATSSSPYFRRLIGLVEQKGNNAEQDLLKRWHDPLHLFISSHSKGLINGTQKLEIGIEDALALKLNIKSVGELPVVGLIDQFGDNPLFAPWVKIILDQGVRFHAGIKMTPTTFSKELYIYASTEHLEQLFGDKAPLTLACKEKRPLFIGIDDRRGTCIYYDATSTSFAEEVAGDIQHPVTGEKLWLWQQSRIVNGQLVDGKMAFEIHPLPLSLMMRLISHYPFPYFRYLIPKRELKNGNFGRDISTGRFAFYGTVS